MNITAIRSDRIYRKMMNAALAEKDNIYRDELMKPFAFKWSCIGIPLKAETDGGYDVVSAAAMNGYYAPAQITEERHAEIDKISNEAFWAACENSIRNTLTGFEQHGIKLPKQEYVFTVVLSDPQSPMTVMAGDYHTHRRNPEKYRRLLAVKIRQSRFCSLSVLPQPAASILSSKNGFNHPDSLHR